MKNQSLVLVVMDEKRQSVDGKINKVARAEQTCAHQAKNIGHKRLLQNDVCPAPDVYNFFCAVQ